MRVWTGLLVCVLALPSATTGASSQSAWVAPWMTEYAAGGDSRAAVLARLSTIGAPQLLQNDLEKLLDDWLDQGTSPETQRRVAAAFALEVAYVKLFFGKQAVDLAEWGCRQVRRLRDPGDFERQWHLAAFALFAGAVDPDAIESHVGHMRLQFRTEPRLLFQRAVAEELRAAPFFEDGKASARDIRRRFEEAARRYEQAAEQEAVKAEANVRLSHTQLRLGKAQEALDALADIETATDDEFVLYLAHLFRGQAHQALNHPGDALREFGLALSVRPRAQSASMAQASLLFETGQRQVADQIVAELLGRTTQPDDPWWNYWPADFRFGPEWLAAMRELVH